MLALGGGEGAPVSPAHGERNAEAGAGVVLESEMTDLGLLVGVVASSVSNPLLIGLEI